MGISGSSLAQQAANAPTEKQGQAKSSDNAKSSSKSSEAKKKVPKKEASKNTAAPKKGPGKPEQTKDQ
jgi:hypothetical protein